jgi:hypothetical protein
MYGKRRTLWIGELRDPRATGHFHRPVTEPRALFFGAFYGSIEIVYLDIV